MADRKLAVVTGASSGCMGVCQTDRQRLQGELAATTAQGGQPGRVRTAEPDAPGASAASLAKAAAAPGPGVRDLSSVSGGPGLSPLCQAAASPGHASPGLAALQ